MAMSGVKMAPEATVSYESFKKKGSGVAFLIFDVVKSNIVVKEEVREEQVPELLAQAKEEGFSQTTTEPDHYALLRAMLLKSDPCYATILLDCKNKDGGVETKMTYIMWNKEDASVKKKMLIASSKDAIAKKLQGLKIKIQANDESEIAYENVVVG